MTLKGLIRAIYLLATDVHDYIFHVEGAQADVVVLRRTNRSTAPPTHARAQTELYTDSCTMTNDTCPDATASWLKDRKTLEAKHLSAQTWGASGTGPPFAAPLPLSTFLLSFGFVVYLFVLGPLVPAFEYFEATSSLTPAIL